MKSYQIKTLNFDSQIIPNCHYQILINSKILQKGQTNSEGKAIINYNLIKNKKIRLKFWAKEQPEDAAFETNIFEWFENIFCLSAKAPKVYEIPLLPTENINHEPEKYAQAFYLVGKGTTWEDIANECKTNSFLLKIENGFRPDEDVQLEQGAKLFLPLGSCRPQYEK